MKEIITALLCLFTLSATAWAAETNVVVTVTNVTTVENGPKAVVDVHVPDGVTLTTNATMLCLVGTDRKDVRPDEFGPPQNFALRGTSHEITPQHFRVTVALPKERVTVRLLLRDGKRTLVDMKKDI